MINRTIVLLLTTALFGGAFAGTAAASVSAIPTTDDEPVLPGDETEDEPIVGPVTTHCGLLPGSGEPASLAGTSSLDDGSCAITHNCRRVDVPHTHRTLLRFVAFRFYQWIRWCWRYPRVLSTQTGEYPRNVDANWRYQGVVARYKHNFNWCCGRSDSGVVSYVQARFDNCIPWIGCLGTVYPWVRIRVHANGTFTSATGT